MVVTVFERTVAEDVVQFGLVVTSFDGKGTTFHIGQSRLEPITVRDAETSAVDELDEFFWLLTDYYYFFCSKEVRLHSIIKTMKRNETLIYIRNRCRRRVPCPNKRERRGDKSSGYSAIDVRSWPRHELFRRRNWDCRNVSIVLDRPVPPKEGYKTRIKWTETVVTIISHERVCVFANMKMIQREKVAHCSGLVCTDEEWAAAHLSGKWKGKNSRGRRKSTREIFHALMATKIASYYQT